MDGLAGRSMLQEHRKQTAVCKAIKLFLHSGMSNYGPTYKEAAEDIKRCPLIVLNLPGVWS